MRLRVPSLALLSGLRTRCRVSRGVGRGRGSDPALLWLWCRPAATTPIGPLAWEPPYATGVALEMAKRQKKKLIGRSPGIKAGVGWGQGVVGAGSKPWPGRGQGPGPGLSQARFRPRSTTLTMVSEARLRQVGGQPGALLWLQLVLLPPWSPTTTLNLRGSCADPGPAPAAVRAVEGGPLTPEAQPLAWAATGAWGPLCGAEKVGLQGLRGLDCDQGLVPRVTEPLLLFAVRSI